MLRNKQPLKRQSFQKAPLMNAFGHLLNCDCKYRNPKSRDLSIYLRVDVWEIRSQRVLSWIN